MVTKVNLGPYVPWIYCQYRFITCSRSQIVGRRSEASPAIFQPVHFPQFEEIPL